MRNAIVLMKRADLFLHGSAERKDGCRMALGELEKVLENDPEDRAALGMKAAMLTALGEPGEAITILTALIQSHEVDQTGVPFPFHFCMAEAFEALGLLERAEEEYLKTIDGCKQAPECGEYMIKSVMGMARVLYQAENSVRLTDYLIRQNRQIVGAHKLLASSLLAMAKSLNAPESVLGYSPTLAGAIEVAYKGLVYEAKWHDHNSQTNRVFLQELLEQAAASEDASCVGKF
jgi:tetratricopeptide (TPR) repeat protein